MIGAVVREYQSECDWLREKTSRTEPGLAAQFSLSIAFSLLTLHFQCFSLGKIGQTTAVKPIDEAPACYISIIDLDKISPARQSTSAGFLFGVSTPFTIPARSKLAQLSSPFSGYEAARAVSRRFHANRQSRCVPWHDGTQRHKTSSRKGRRKERKA